MAVAVYSYKPEEMISSGFFMLIALAFCAAWLVLQKD
jgi:hypothetical protein